MDTVRRSIQRASALTASDLKKGVSALATIGSTAPFVGLLGTVVGVINAFQGIARQRLGRYRRRLGRYCRSARRDRARAGRRDSGGVVLQLPDRPHRVLQRRDGQLVVGARRLLHQEDGVRRLRRRAGFRLQVRIARARRSGTTAVRTRQSLGDLAMAMDLGGAKGGVKSDINVTPLVRRHAGAAHHHDARRPAAAAGRQRQAADGDEHGRQARDAGPDGHRHRREQVDLPERQADSRSRAGDEGQRAAREQEGKDRPHQGRRGSRVRRGDGGDGPAPAGRHRGHRPDHRAQEGAGGAAGGK